MSGQQATGLALAVGARLGSYEILSFVGAGGMGQVYRAKDTRLGRVVALKVLSPGTSENRDRRLRFLAEARAVSSLQHANVCTLHDMGNEGGVDFLVMEYVEGETLAARLRHGCLPIRDVLRYGIEIAAALDAAHSKGLVHRDIKPGNIMLTKSGVKLLDFGLAKAQARITDDAADEPTTPQTEAGAIVGTLHYISPEQLDGNPADTLSDLFSLGAVLFEMATGERAFDGHGSAGVVQAILKHEPPLVSTIRATDLPVFDRLVQQCLMKDPSARIQSANDVKLFLEWINGPPVERPVVQRSTRRRVLLVLSTAAIAILMSIASIVVSRRQVQDLPSIRSTILPPAGSEFRLDDYGTVALSPDGTRLAFAATRDDGTSVLWIRRLRDESTETLAGTEGAFSPFWSPDSRNLGFFSGGKLKKVAATGGPPQVLCDAVFGMGGTWNSNGIIVFSPAPQGFLFQVPAAGGDPKELTTADRSIRGEFNHLAPSFLPDGVHFLYTGRSRWSVLGKFQRIYLGSLEGGEPKALVDASSNALFAPSGHLLYVRDGVLVAHPFDASRGELSGEARPLTGPIRQVRALGLANFSISNDGLLIFQEAGQARLSRLSWISRSGQPLGTLDAPAEYLSLRLSHDGNSLLTSVVDPLGQSKRIWLHDLRRASKTRLTFSSDEDSDPIWSADDREIFFQSTRPPAYIPDLYRKRLDAGGSEELLLPPHPGVVAVLASAVSPDGKVVLYSGPAYPPNLEARLDLYAYSLPDRKSFHAIGGEHDQVSSSFSPDGEWIAYDSVETGRPEIYVRRFSGGRTWQVSQSGGSYPKWSGDGQEIFFQSLDGKIMSVAVTTNPQFEAATPQALFPVTLKGGEAGMQYDVAPDGKRFILNVPVEEHAPPLTLVQNWTAQLK